jgi:hypothetical protein
MGKGDGARRVSQNRFQPPPCGSAWSQMHAAVNFFDRAPTSSAVKRVTSIASSRARSRRRRRPLRFVDVVCCGA